MYSSLLRMNHPPYTQMVAPPSESSCTFSSFFTGGGDNGFYKAVVVACFMEGRDLVTNVSFQVFASEVFPGLVHMIIIFHQ